VPQVEIEFLENGSTKWKSKLIVKGTGMAIPLGDYLKEGCLIGLKDASTLEILIR